MRRLQAGTTVCDTTNCMADRIRLFCEVGDGNAGTGVVDVTVL
jgi:hypothetical protein